MHSANHWGGSFDINGDSIAEDEDDRSRKFTGELDRAALHHRQHQDQQHPVPPSNLLLDETQQSWLLGPQDPNAKKKKYIDLGCIVCSRQAFKWTVGSIIVAFLVIGLPIIIVKTLPESKLKVTPPDDYTVALKKALLFFDAQMSGRLPKGHRVPWRGNSGLKDGSELTDVKGGLVGGYYDAGDNIKFHFPMAFSMSMLSWSVLEYSHKYKAIGEYDHVREIIKWGTDYLLLTFNSSATVIDKVYSQVGVGRNGTTTPDDHYCWQRPEDMDYDRPVQTATSAPDLAAEMASALASASIVFRDNLKYSQKLVKGAKALYDFARNGDKRERYSRGNLDIEPFYNSTNYFDEHMWSAAWMYYATGNASYYLSLATNPGIPKNANAFKRIPDLSVLSWENKLPAAELLLTRLRIFLSPGYPYEDMLSSYYSQTGLNMCSYLRKFNVFNWTQGGMIQLNHGRPQPLQYVANAAFISSLFVDYMKAIGVPGWNCGPNYIDSKDLANFATSQVNYILGANPRKMSYLVGYGTKFPRHVHHRGASMPRNKKKYGCIDGRKWLKTANPNPINITGAMVGGPNKQDGFIDVRTNYNYTEPTLAGNAGLVAALVSLTSSGRDGIDKNTIFSAIPPLFPAAPPPPPPWKP